MKCECGTEYEGNFCPNCGKKAEKRCAKCGKIYTGSFCSYCGSGSKNLYSQTARNGNRRSVKKDRMSTATGHKQIKKKKGHNRNLKVILIVVVIIAIISSRKSGDTRGLQKNNDDIKSRLSDIVTEDYLPGTYESKDGEIFAISVDDESIFSINVTLANIFKGKDWSTCWIVSSATGWIEEAGILDLSDKTITVLGEPDIDYYYKLNKKQLTLTDEEGEQITYTKISDEFNVDILTENSIPMPDDVVGVYVDKGGTVKRILIVERFDEYTANVYYLNTFSENENGIPGERVYVEGLAEQVPMSAFSESGNVMLKGRDDFDTCYVDFIGKDIVNVDGGMNCIRDDIDTSVYTEEINTYKEQHPQVDYQYSSFTDLDVLYTNSNHQPYIFNKEWYNTYSCFSAWVGGDIYLELKVQKTDTGEIQILINGQPYCSFSGSNYQAGDQASYVVYQCEDGAEIEYYPKWDEDYNNGTTSMIRFNEFDLERLGYDYTVEYGLDFEYFGEGVGELVEDTAEKLAISEGNEIQISQNNEHWFVDYPYYYNMQGEDELSIYSMNDTILSVTFIGINGEYYEWVLNIEPDEIGSDGELIYYSDDISLSYYPSDHHIKIISSDTILAGEYWPD